MQPSMNILGKAITLLQSLGVECYQRKLRTQGMSTGIAFTYAEGQKVSWDLKAGRLSGIVVEERPSLEYMHPAIRMSVNEQLATAYVSYRLVRFSDDPKTYLELVLVEEGDQAAVMALDLAQPFEPVKQYATPVSFQFGYGAVVVFDPDYFGANMLKITNALELRLRKTHLILDNPAQVMVVLLDSDGSSVRESLKLDGISFVEVLSFGSGAELVLFDKE